MTKITNLTMADMRNIIRTIETFIPADHALRHAGVEWILIDPTVEADDLMAIGFEGGRVFRRTCITSVCTNSIVEAWAFDDDSRVYVH